MNVKLNVTDSSRVIKLILSGTGVRGASGASGSSSLLEITGIVDTAASLPTAGDYTTKFFLARDTGVIYYSDGTQWIVVNISYTGVPGWEIVESLPVDPDPDVLYFVPEPA